MVDNYKLIKDFLKFDSEDDFYFVQIIQRRKDNQLLPKSTRVIKSYYVDSVDYFESIYTHLKYLCNLYNARATIRLNRRSYKNVATKVMGIIAESFKNDTYKHIRKSYDSACGSEKLSKDRYWIIDIDPEHIEFLPKILKRLEAVKGNSDYIKIPSKNGYHIVTSPFNIELFYKESPSGYASFPIKLDIQKDSYTNLYIP